MPETVPCNLCGARDATPQPRLTRFSGNPEPYRVCRCNRCGLEFLSPRPTLDELEQKYATHWYYAADNADRGASRTRFYTGRVRRVERHRPSRGRWLGIACLEGGYANRIAADRGWQVVAVEFSRILADHARRELGLDVRTSRAWDLSAVPETSFDVIYSHSLEHVPDPRQTLVRCRRHLAPDGLLVLEVPHQFHSVKDLLKLGLREVPGLRAERWLHQEDLEGFHLYFFTPRTLRSLLENAGYQVLSLRTYLPFHPVYLSKPPRAWLQETLHLLGAPLRRGPVVEMVARAV